MTPDLERVARAIFEELFGGGDEYANELIHHPAAKSWDRPTEPRWTQCSEAARAAVAALMEVSDKAMFMSLPKFDTRGGASVGRRHFQDVLRAVLGDAE